MRKYISEKVGIVELFQIIVAAVVLSLGYYGLSSDHRWNEAIDDFGVTMCVKINREIFNKSSTILYNSQCPKLGFRDRNACIPLIHRKYLASAKKDQVVTGAGKKKNITRFMNKYMKRNVVSEKSFLVVVSCIFVALTCHLITSFVPKMANSIKLRTKWNAANQGIVMFGSGFAAVLVSISAHTIETNYKPVYSQIQPCGMLRYCAEGHDSGNRTAERIVNNALDENDACQQIYIKKAACVLLIILIGMCLVMIMMALDLTTKYEHEEGMDVEVPAEELGGLDTLIEDQEFAFGDSDLRASNMASDDRTSQYSLMMEPAT